MSYVGEFEPLWKPQPVSAAATAEAETRDRRSYDAAEVYARGYEDGSRDATQAARAAEDRLVDMHRAELARLKAELHDRSISEISAHLTAQITALETCLKRALLNLLAPSIVDHLEYRGRQSLNALVGQATEFKTNTQVLVSGPADFTQTFSEELSAAGYDVKVSGAPSDDLTVTIGETVLRSKFQKAVAELREILDER